MTRPLIIGHRGASRSAPENTLAALELAMEGGADGVEFDVRLAADGVPVVIHDADLVRTAGIRKKVSELTSVELAAIDVGSWFARRRGTPFADQAVPLFESALELLAGRSGQIYVELKCGRRRSAELVAAVCEALDRSSLLARVIVISFDLEAVAEVKQVLPSVQTGALFGPEVRRYFKRRRHLINNAIDHGADRIVVHRSLVTPGLCKAAGSAGVPVTVWTVDDPRWVRRALRFGVEALITNDPGRLLAAREDF
jgi:glycerophosphoryl diester phosphodiesterase